MISSISEYIASAYEHPLNALQRIRVERDGGRER